MCIYTSTNLSCFRCHDPIHLITERCHRSRTGTCTTPPKFGLSFGPDWVCSRCHQEAVEWLGPELERIEIALKQEQESFDANALRIPLEERHHIAATLTAKRNTCRKYRATLDQIGAVAAWQRKADEADELLHEEHRIITAEEEAFLIRTFGTDVLRSSTALETALRDFEALRLMRDILDPGWRIQYSELGPLGTPAELEYWEARNDIWREQRIRDILDAGVTDEFHLAEDLEDAVAGMIDEAMCGVARRAADMLRMRRCARRFERRRDRKMRARNMGL